MPDSLCRLAIQPTDRAGEHLETVDLTLPADSPVAELIPAIVDVVVPEPFTVAEPLRWHLTRICGQRLMPSMTLRENDVHDGEVILLTTEPGPSPRRRPGDASGLVAAAANPAPAQLPDAVTVAGIAVTAVSAATLAWTGVGPENTGHLWTAATLSAAGAISAVLSGRPAHRTALPTSLAAVSFAMVTGFLAGPDAAWAPALLLAGSPGFAVSIMLLHMTCGHTAVLNAAAAATGAMAAAGAIGTSATLPVGATGALLTVLSLAALSIAPKLTVAAVGLGPSRPEVGDRRAEVGHHVLTGLVAGWSFSMTLGIAAVAAAALAGVVTPATAAMFAADVGLLLILRGRTHVDARRRMTLGAAGLCAVTAAFVVTVSAEPGHGNWFCAALAATGVAIARWGTRSEGSNPIVGQMLQTIEYLALAAAVPLAVWVAGGYGLVRAVSLG